MRLTDLTMRSANTGTIEAGVLRRLPEPTEEQIHRAVIELLERTAHAGVFWFHVPNGEKRGPGLGGKLKGMGTRAGMPDVMLLRAGRSYGLELKKRGGKVSPSQRMTHALMTACGAEARTVYSLDEAIAALKGWGMIK